MANDNNQNNHTMTATDAGATTPRRQVSFHNTPIIRQTIALENFTQLERYKTWWGGHEFNYIYKSCAKQIHKINAGFQLKDIKYCSRGLESHTQLGSLSKCKTRNESIAAVLSAQEKMIKMEVNSCDRVVYIAQVYSQVTSSCQMWAHCVALSDAQEAYNILDHEDPFNGEQENKKQRRTYKKKKIIVVVDDIEPKVPAQGCTETTTDKKNIDTRSTSIVKENWIEVGGGGSIFAKSA